MCLNSCDEGESEHLRWHQKKATESQEKNIRTGTKCLKIRPSGREEFDADTTFDLLCQCALPTLAPHVPHNPPCLAGLPSGPDGAGGRPFGSKRENFLRLL